MGECPPSLTIERKENNQGYSPENCKWATRKEQANNRRIRHDAHLLTFEGRTQSLFQWAKEKNILPSTLVSRITTMGWTADRALTETTSRNKPRSKATITIDGITKLISEWAKDFNISLKTVTYRLKSGWDIDRALKEPIYKAGRQKSGT